MKAKSRNTLRVPGWFKRRKEGVRSRITHKIYQSFAPGLISIKISNTRRIDSKIELLFNQFAIWLMREQIVTEPIWRLSHPSRVRGLKSLLLALMHICLGVAPFTGAWIEINPRFAWNACNTWSHPSRVRGLKCTNRLGRISGPAGRTLHGCVDWNDALWLAYTSKRLSHPSRVRGLKYPSYHWLEYRRCVAPFTGAWIEMSCRIK